MLKLIFRDLFIYQGKHLFILPGFALLVILQMQVNGSDTVLPLAIIASSLFAMLSTTQYTFNGDEFSKFNRFLRATPALAKEIVLSRYVSCLLSAVISVVLVLIAAILTNIVSVICPSLWRDLTVNANTILICVIVTLLVCSILFPILFKFGYAKSKYFLLLLIVGVGACTPMWVTSTANQAIGFLLSLSTGGYFIIAILSLIVLYGSTLLSTMAFKKNEI